MGKRSSPYKMSFDLQAWRQIADDASRDGKTDMLARAIFTAKKGRFGLHSNFGFQKNDDSFGDDDQYVAAAGLEFFPMARLRLIAELEAKTEAQPEPVYPSVAEVLSLTGEEGPEE